MKKSSFEFRILQRKRILATKPWLKSTGPKTKMGKDVSKMNSLKLCPKANELMKEAKELLWLQRKIMKELKI